MTIDVTFPTSYEDIIERVESVDPGLYAKTRNFVDGDVSYLSPYISRGVISTSTVMHAVLDRDLPWREIEKFIQELAWRDYWQQIWKAKGDAISEDLKHAQPRVANRQIPVAILTATTGIHAIDACISSLYRTGYMHNHVRMYVASIATHLGQSHWLKPAQWMYFHLLDGDWASNALSWQWVAGTSRNKTYVANQDNINKYCRTNQRGTFLDVPYDALDTMDVPKVLREVASPALTTELPKYEPIKLNADLPLLIYNSNNLSPQWKKDMPANRVLLLEPSHFERYPVSDKVVRFLTDLGENIAGLQIYTGSFDDLISMYAGGAVYYKEHPTCSHYRGIQESRDWMFDVHGYFPSFFNFWKQCKKVLGR